MNTLNIKQFKQGAALSFCLAIVLFTCSYAIGKNQLFLLLNANLGIVADYFFGIYTNAGDGTIWIAILLITLFIIKKKNTWPLLVSAFAISTILTQVCKNFILPNTPRPWNAIANHNLIHHVLFIPPYHVASFPSGHTGTAFSVYLVLCLLINKKWWLWMGFILASLVGYARIYLAQHFPFDVAAGIIVGIISVWVSLLIQQAIDKNRLKKIV